MQKDEYYDFSKDRSSLSNNYSKKILKIHMKITYSGISFLMKIDSGTCIFCEFLQDF